MYRKKSRGWYKHKDFIFLDLVCLLLSLILAYLVRNGSVRNLFELGIYHNMIFFVILADLFLIIIFESYKGVLRRGYYQELRSVIQQMILIELASGLYGVYVGVPGKCISERFENKKLEDHINILKEKSKW